jgi:hypothetical protein
MPARARTPPARPPGRRSQGRSGRQALCALIAVAAILLVPAAARSAQSHAFSMSFGASGSGAGQLSLAFPELSDEEKPLTAGSGVAVDDETGDVYVADTGNHRVSEFDPSRPAYEAFIRAFGANVGGAGVDVCTSSCAPGTPGSEPGQLSAPTFIAVDNACDLHEPLLTQATTPKCSEFDPSNGDVYVADTAGGGENRVSKFDAEGRLVSSWGTKGQLDGSAAPVGSFESIKGVAVDPAGDLWVQGGPGGASLLEFTESGGFIEEWVAINGQQPTGIALDGAQPEHVYLLGGFPEGPIYRLTTDDLEEGAVLRAARFFTGIAADQRTDELYADEEGASIADVSPRCDPSEGLCAPTQVFGEGDLEEAAGLGVDAATGTVYAAIAGEERVAAFPVALEAATGSATEIEATTATVHGTVDPKGSPVTHCAFQYGEGQGYGQEAPCVNGVGEVVGIPAEPLSSEAEVHADLAALHGGASYDFRLRLGDEANAFLSSEAQHFGTRPIATIGEAKATELTGTSALLTGTIDAMGVAGTRCELEWGTSTAYGTTVPCEPADIPSGAVATEVAVHLSGLHAGTTYHFNFSINDDNGTTLPEDHTFIFNPASPAQRCENEALREVNNSTGLPDCRAYELVTPMDKNGALIGALLFGDIPPQIEAGGDRVIAPSIQCFDASLSCVGTREAEGEPFQFERTGSGWSSASLALPATSFDTSSAWGFNADTGDALFGAPTPPGGQDDWYVRAPDGEVSDLGPLWQENATIKTIEPEPIVTTANFSHVLWEMKAPAWLFDGGEGNVHGLYEYPGVEGSASAPQLVAVSGGPGSHELIGTCGASVAGRETYTQTYGSVSADGRTTFFQVEPCTHGWGEVNGSRRVYVQEIFARIDGEGPEARTVAISEPAGLYPAQADPACATEECVTNTSNPASFRSAEFEGASSDGTMAYFTSPQQLTDQASQDHDPTDDAHLGGCSQTQGAGGCNLYLFEDPQQQPLTGTHLIDVSAGDTSGIGPEVQGMLALSTDGTHAYFVAKGVLSEAANAEGGHAAEGADNLYLYQRDAAHPNGQTTFIAVLSNANKRTWALGVDAANVTPDGRFLVFESSRGLTPDARTEGAAQIYRYDAETNQLQRISFGRQGFDDNGNAAGAAADATVDPAANTIVYRYGPVRSDPTMSDDGSYVFFRSPVALTTGALNEVPVGTEGFLAQNIYEWEQDGIGACTEPTGCISLISDGKDTAEGGKGAPSAVELLGTDTTGQNVFFTTTDRLTPEDTDTQRDYYDARIDGGFPAPENTVPCEGEACHPTTIGPPVFAALGTLAFTGPGNLASPTTRPPLVKPPTKAQKLAKALDACRARKSKRKRAACEKTARKRYGPKAKKQRKRSS